MKITVCIKQIDYIYHPLAFDSIGGGINPEKKVHMLNPYDEVAVEVALRIKGEFSDSEIVLISVGTSRVNETLRYAFAMGADKMIRIHSDTAHISSISKMLANTICKKGFDIILCGKKAMDTNDNLVPSFIAEALAIPQVSGIVGLQPYPDANKVMVERYLGKGDREVVECPMPALFTIEMGMNEPRYPSLVNRQKAEQTEIEVIEPSFVDSDFEALIKIEEVSELSAPRPKPKKVRRPASNLSPAERMAFVMSGGVEFKKCDIIQGTAEEMVKKIIETMIEEKIID